MLIGKKNKWLKLISLVIICFSGSLTVFSQSNFFVNKNIVRTQQRALFLQNDTNLHSAILPYDHGVLDAIGDSIYQPSAFNLVKKSGAENWTYSLQPSASLVYDGDEAYDPLIQTLVGVNFRAKFKNRLQLRTNVFGGIISAPNLEGAFDQKMVLEGIGSLNEAGDNYSLLNFNGAVTYTPSHIFSLELGRGKHQFGDGYRSLLLASDAINYPYFKVRTKVWHIEYINLFSMQKGLRSTLDAEFDYTNKFTSTHLLSWNIKPNLNVYFFETIIWQNEDTLSNRGFDLNYLNPIIFYRPVEFAIGSSDNAMVGAGSAWRPNKQLQIYGQFVVDEMVFDQFISRTGWWANKYGAQLGFKYFDPFKIKDSYVQMEWNQVRPFTYSHGSPQQNYAHYNQPLAHPAGSNFYEFMALMVKKHNRFEGQLQASFTLKGDDIPATDSLEYQNLGGDVFRSYVDPFYVRGNSVGQGITSNILNLRLGLAYIFDEQHDGRVYLGYRYNYIGFDYSNLSSHLITAGVRLNFSDFGI